MLKIGIPLFDGVDELDAIGPFEVFQNGIRFGAALSCDLLAASTREPITASHGLKMFATATTNDGPWGCLVVPGGNWARPDSVGVRTQIQAGALPQMIASVHQGGGLIASVCTGAMLLSAAGILKGRRATTHQVAKIAMVQEGAQLIDARVVDDGEIITAGGVTSGIDLALYLLARLFDPQIAKSVQQLMEYNPSGEVWRGGENLPWGQR
jgi:transcriptional regulator GlxA family with amidase domain